jgi:hypothetical protein
MNGPGPITSPCSPAAFMSYAHKDDKHDFNQLSMFRERLSGEIQVQTAQDFDIFHDRTSITWGQRWKERIDEALDGSTFLLVFLTPNFFGSTECRREVRKFMARERQTGHQRLILPVYYISAKQVDAPRECKKDALITAIGKHNYFDWRPYRFESFEAQPSRKAMAALAEQIIKSF